MKLDINPKNVETWIKGANITALQTNKQHELQVHRWFLSILLDKGKTFPIHDVNAHGVTKSELFQDFIERLIFFWSGRKSLSTQDMYCIDFTPKGYPKRVFNKNTILLPRNVANKHELYSKLIVATFNVTEGRGLYGGGA